MLTNFPTKGSKGVRFVYYTDTPVKSVALAGTFNNWNGDRNYMSQMEDGAGWEIELPIAKGRHLYKLVVNGEAWIVDPLNPSISEDAQNNSAITVTEDGEVLIRTNEISKDQPGYMYENFTALSSPEWLRKSVIYELHLRAFGETGFQGLADKIGYFKELGINALWLMPFHEVGHERRIGKYGDPYAVKDFYSIDPQFGTKEDLLLFMRKAHENGIKVVLDWVLNRASVDHILTDSHPDYFTHNEQGELYYDVPNREYFAGLEFSNRDMRKYVIEAMKYWITAFDFDGIRLDDSDITPYDFLTEIKQALQEVKADLILISQSYDEYHHLESCDLTYNGNPRILIRQMIDGTITQADFITNYNSYKYSFPKNALRMNWLEDKEQSRICDYLGAEHAGPAASILLTLEGVPLIMMGQEFNENTMETWTSLFDEYKLNWDSFDKSMFEHYKYLTHLRTNEPAFWAGELAFVRNSENRVLSYIRQHEGVKFLIIVNLSGELVNVQFDQETLADEFIKDKSNLLYRTGRDGIHAEQAGSTLSVNRYETIIFQISEGMKEEDL
ncbi:alpha amylase catalytic region [Paenibacillus curdlanolyticus YK9]|uniref:Alpha amylase catalytic region n=1 Tax=Paenibacillus curdlanolyticus YK9 TaxID=717606 RepID=E0I9I0_9BACL|nr:alpha-amylase family glycosyl hydrolase [Paenibacillus curdlanolyticus]EFM11064.1 alpha amylase catalytic region [Paenibacillus curdlanolyticus YK9]